MSELTEFYSGEGTDYSGRSLAYLLAYSDEALEDTHDFIQWLFPLPEPSRFVPNAPLLTRKDMAHFRSNPQLQSNMRRAFDRMMRFYSNPQWITPHNHNFMRITRILRSLSLCGLEIEAQTFLSWLRALPFHHLETIGDSMKFWENAVTASK